MRGKQAAIKQVEKPKVIVDTKKLSDNTVNKFLIVYYTKKDLQENTFNEIKVTTLEENKATNVVIVGLYTILKDIERLDKHSLSQRF